MGEPGVAYLSIGEVLGRLLEEFPDVTISKIRFLESQGLIEPERTPSGYRKFLPHDVDLLRVILREQRQNFLPLRVIKDRLDSGAIDRSGTPPEGVASPASVADGPEEGPSPSSIAAHPAARRATGAQPTVTPPRSDGAEPTVTPVRSDDAEPTGAGATASSPRLLPGVVVNRDELCAMAGVTREQLASLEEYGVIAKRKSGNDLYSEDAVEVAAAAGALLSAGVDARHLRAWRTSVEREVGLYEQLIMPLLRQRNPQSRAQAAQRLDELNGLGTKLRHALARATVHHQFGL
jgi:DNA-binding transcriptional MerR regulator